MKDKLLPLLFVFLVALVLLLFTAVFAQAEELPDYTIMDIPEIAESVYPCDFYVAAVLKVDLSWESVYNDVAISTYITMPILNEKVYAVWLTDGFTIVHAYVERRGETVVYAQFETEPIRRFFTSHPYLVIIATDG